MRQAEEGRAHSIQEFAFDKAVEVEFRGEGENVADFVHFSVRKRFRTESEHHEIRAKSKKD